VEKHQSDTKINLKKAFPTLTARNYGSITSTRWIFFQIVVKRIVYSNTLYSFTRKLCGGSATPPPSNVKLTPSQSWKSL